jgi:hypothetical protein
MRLTYWTLLALIAHAGAAAAQELTVAGHQLSVKDDGMGSAALLVDGGVLHENGVIYLDAKELTVGGVTVVTGSAGAGGNACNAAPFVLSFPEGAAPEFWGPVESCAYFVPEDQGSRLLFMSETSTNVGGRVRPDEVWIWTPEDGFGSGPAFGSAAVDSGWEALDTLAGAHPANALLLTPVVEALQSGLGEDYPVFAERISDLGAGNLTAEGYLGSACLKFTCDADFAILYLHRESQQVFAIWHVMGEIENRIWPEDTTLWPPEPMALLRDMAGP